MGGAFCSHRDRRPEIICDKLTVYKLWLEPKQGKDKFSIGGAGLLGILLRKSSLFSYLMTRFINIKNIYERRKYTSGRGGGKEGM